MTKHALLSEQWSGRIDNEDASLSIRLHQQVQVSALPDTFERAPVILGFVGDEGVRRHVGVVGDAQGPQYIRRALSNLACSPDFQFYDAGDVVCIDEQLDESQQRLSAKIMALLAKDARPFVLGGGHEMAFASYLGCQQYLAQQSDVSTLGVLNFSAHFGLRNADPVATSDTVFRQAHEWSEEHDVPFHYAVFGIDPSANSDAQFGYAFEAQVTWVEDLDCHVAAMADLKQQLRDWLAPLDAVYLTLNMDVFSAADAPGVSDSASVGVAPVVVLKLLQFLVDEVENSAKKILLVDVAGVNPGRDTDQRSAKLAARFIHQMMM